MYETYRSSRNWQTKNPELFWISSNFTVKPVYIYYLNTLLLEETRAGIQSSLPDSSQVQHLEILSFTIEKQH